MWIMGVGTQTFYQCLCKSKKKGVVWLPMRQLSTRYQNDTEMNKYSHRTAFNNEQNPYRIVSYERPRSDNVKLCSNEKTNGLIYVQKNERKTNM